MKIENCFKSFLIKKLPKLYNANVLVLKMPRFDVANIKCFTVVLKCIKLDRQIHLSEKVELCQWVSFKNAKI